MLVSKRVCFMKKALKPKRSGSQRRRVVARRRAAVRARRAPAFFEARSLDELAREQGVKPLADTNSLNGGWPEDEDLDAFLKKTYDDRRASPPA